MMNLQVKKPFLLHSLWAHPDSSYKLKVREMNLPLVKTNFFLSSLSYHQRQWRDIPIQTPELPEQGCDRSLQVVTSGRRRYHLRQIFTLMYSHWQSPAKPCSQKIPFLKTEVISPIQWKFSWIMKTFCVLFWTKSSFILSWPSWHF